MEQPLDELENDCHALTHHWHDIIHVRSDT